MFDVPILPLNFKRDKSESEVTSKRLESILSMEKPDIHIELPDGTVIDGQDEHSKVLESFFANNVTGTILDITIHLSQSSKNMGHCRF